MGEVAATEFKAKCLELMDRVAERHESFMITKRGRPVARLVPIERVPRESLFGWLRGKATIAGDLLAPVAPPEAWEAVRGAAGARVGRGGGAWRPRRKRR